MINSNDLSIIFDAYFSKIYRYFYYKTLSHEEAEDLTSEAFLGFTVSVRQGRQIEHIESYLFGISRNVFNTFLRKKYQLREVSLDSIPDPAAEISHLSSAQVDIKRFAQFFVDRLPDAQRAVLQLRLIEQKPLSEICLVLSKDMNYVKTTQKRGIANLKKLLACTPVTTIK